VVPGTRFGVAFTRSAERSGYLWIPFEYLNPVASSSDRLLTTLGLLKVNQEEGQTYIDTYLPFVFHCLEVGGYREVSAPQLKEDLIDEFEIELPHAVIRRLLEEAEKRDKLNIEAGVYVVEPKAIAGSSLGAAIAEVERGRRLLVEALVEFAGREFGLDWEAIDAETEVATYINGFSSRVLAAAVTGDPLPQLSENRDGDQYVVHRFAQTISTREPELFEMLVSLVKGRMLADAMYFLSEAADKPPSMEKVEVYLDGPPLLFTMGYAGAEMQAPYVELLNMLKKQNALVRYFEHSLTEAQEILDAAVARAQTGSSGESYPGDVVSCLVRSGKSPVEIEMLSNRLKSDLLRLGINPMETPARKQHLEIDEVRLGEKLQRSLNYKNRLARDRDIDSLTAIHRIRDGKELRDLENCRAIFVTHNTKLFRTSAVFFRQKDRRTIPPCVLDMALATMLWLRDPSGQAKLPEERIMARAYAALNPNDQLWTRYSEEIDRLRRSDEISEDDAIFLRYDRDAQEALMDETRGDPGAFSAGTVEQVITRAKENLLAETRAERDAAVGAIRGSRRRVDRIAVWWGERISWTLFGVVLVGLLLGAMLGPVGPVPWEVTPPAVQAICAGLVVLIGLVTAIHSPSLLEYRAMLAQWLTRQFRRGLLAIVRLGPGEGSAEE
jgi:hypothetical protein